MTAEHRCEGSEGTNERKRLQAEETASMKSLGQEEAEERVVGTESREEGG